MRTSLLLVLLVSCQVARSISTAAWRSRKNCQIAVAVVEQLQARNQNSNNIDTEITHTHKHTHIDRDATHPAAVLIVFHTHTHTHSSFPALHPKNLNKTPQNIKNQIISLKKKTHSPTASDAARKTIIAPPLSQLFTNHHHKHTPAHSHTRTVGLSLTPADNVDFFSCSRANLSLFDSFSICFSNFCSAVVAVAAIVVALIVVVIVVVARELHTFLLF